jgi:hypothetical protein
MFDAVKELNELVLASARIISRLGAIGVKWAA